MTNKTQVARLCVGCILAIALITSMAFAANVTSDNKVWQAKANGKYKIQAYFNPQHTVVDGEGYSLKPGRRVKQAYVRAQSEGCKTPIFGITICSAVDTGRCYSKVAKKTDRNIFSTPEASVVDCSFCKQTTNYGWVYF